MDIPPHLLSEVTCTDCGAFLARSPVLVLDSGHSVCGHHDVVEAKRNSAYEALAQMMRFPCRFRPRGCTETPVWDSGHEEECVYGDVEVRGKRGEEKGEKCSVCQGNIYVMPRYECLRGHKICPTCTTPTNFRCQLCKAKINHDIIYLCKFWTFGCKFKSNKDSIMRHEVDCDMRGYSCPFQIDSCKWSGALHTMSQHLKTTHFDETVLGEDTTVTFKMKDTSWVMVAHGEVFQCYCWMEESSVEWLAKYVGPQNKCLLYSCEVRLFSTSDRSVFRMVNRCHGWNNVSLEKGIRVSFEDMAKYLTKGQCSFKFKIIKN